MKGIIARKLGMTQVYDEKGVLTPVTVVLAGPCPVLGVRTVEKHGYAALQLGFGTRKIRNASKAIQGVCKAAGVEAPPETIGEIRLDKNPEAKPGDVVRADIFKQDEFVDVLGTTKGRGFQGVVKRHHFAGGRASHGGGWHRRGGSIGCKEKPGNIIKGKRMPGHLGHAMRTVQNLRVVKVALEDNLLFIKGAVPGPNNGILVVKSAIKKSNIKK